jgi:hypothetical protein
LDSFGIWLGEACEKLHINVFNLKTICTYVVHIHNAMGGGLACVYWNWSPWNITKDVSTLGLLLYERNRFFFVHNYEKKCTLFEFFWEKKCYISK